MILGRDGVINPAPLAPLRSPAEWEPLPGSLEAIARLNRAGYRIVVAAARPTLDPPALTIETLSRIHQKMHRLLAEVGGSIEAVFFCPHRPRSRCRCSAPRSGLLEDISNRLRQSLDGVPVLVDSHAEMEAARAVGARPILITSGGARPPAQALVSLEATEAYADLAAAADAMLR